MDDEETGTRAEEEKRFRFVYGVRIRNYMVPKLITAMVRLAKGRRYGKPDELKYLGHAQKELIEGLNALLLLQENPTAEQLYENIPHQWMVSLYYKIRRFHTEIWLVRSDDWDGRLCKNDDIIGRTYSYFPCSNPMFSRLLNLAEIPPRKMKLKIWRYK